MIDIQTGLAIAYAVAAASPDPSNQNGAVILEDRTKRILTVGCNEVPGMSFTPEELSDREWKLRHIEHAERRAILRLIGLTCQGPLTMFSPWAPCCDCAKAMLQAGIRSLIVHQPRMALTPERWLADVNAGLEILHREGVEITRVAGPISAGTIRVEGKQWSPQTCCFV